MENQNPQQNGDAAATRNITSFNPELEKEVIDTIRTCYDPEIPVNIYDLGLIYHIDIDENANCDIKMTLTSPACPVAGTLPPDVESRVDAIQSINSCKVEVVWDPPWNPDMMTEAAKLELGF